MKNLCITGYNQKFLDECALYIEKSGVKPALPAVRGQEISIHTWHEKVCNAHESSKNTSDTSITVGRVWDQIAGDIFFANHAESIWYWADARSLSLLDYWKSFDPHTYFILIHASLRDLIGEEINIGNTSRKRLEQVVSEWTSKAVSLLNFNSNNADRCVIIDHSSFGTKKHDYIKDIAGRWNLKLNAPLKYAESTEVKVETNVLTQYLSEELIKTFPEALALEKEIQQNLIESEKSKPRKATKLSIIESAIMEYADLLMSFKKNKELMEQASHSKEILEKELSIQTSEVEKYKSDCIKIDEQLKSASEQYNKLKVASDKLLEEEQTEKNLIIETLHNTQESLESSLMRQTALSTDLDMTANQLKKLLIRNPDYWDYGTLSTTMTSSKSTEKSSLWKFTDLFINGRLINNLEFKLVSKSNYAGIIFLRGDKEHPAPLLRWPVDPKFSEEFPCTPTKGALTLEQNKIISSLSSTDWSMLRSLVKLLIELLSDNENWKAQQDFDTNTFTKGLISLKNTLDKWPTVLRFDAASVGGISHGEHYHCFEIALKNLNLGDKFDSNFIYRISTIDEFDAQFGQNPRLEFPESTRDFFDEWYSESTDQRGPRLELRFALPNEMDTHVWNKLSNNDKVLIAGLVGITPSRIIDVSQQSPSDSQRWEDWSSLANLIKSILINNISPPAKKNGKSTQ